MQTKKCITPGCNNMARKEARDCEKCHSRKFRKKHPIRVRWHWLKESAKKRGYEFNLSFEYFKNLCIESEYHLKSGRKANDLTLDRIRNELGYIEGNVRVVIKSVNSKKRDLPWEEVDEAPF